MKASPALVIYFLCSWALTHAQIQPKAGFVLEQLSNDLYRPSALAMTPDGRIIIGEKSGTFWVYENGELLTLPFLQLTVDDKGERGVQSITLDPNFEQNGFVYVYYSVFDENHNRLSRFTTNGNTVIPGTETILMDFDQLDGIFHNGGAIRFENDSTLFVTTGDGINPAYSQSADNLLGKVLRIRSNGEIPSDNPFFNDLEGKQKSIYALGLRNPFTFDYSNSMQLGFINDVGASSVEEINRLEAGVNYGWPLVEGFRTGETVPDSYRDPFYAYSQTDGRCAVVGGSFYDPDKKIFPPEWHDTYLFSDFCRGDIYRMHPTTGVIEDTLLTGASFLSNMAVGGDGALYFLRIYYDELWKISFQGGEDLFLSIQPEHALGAVGESIPFAVEALGKAPLTHQWFVNGEAQGQDSSLFLLTNITMEDSASHIYCEISNANDTILSDTAILTVTTNQRPTASISLPANSTSYRCGDTLWFEGLGEDPELGVMDSTHYAWSIDFVHDDHHHPVLPPTLGISNGYYVIPTIGETDTNVAYKVMLTVTDPAGLDNQAQVIIQPSLTTIDLSTEPAGFPMKLDGPQMDTPLKIRSVVGNTRILEAPEYHVRNDSLFRFTHWDNGSSSTFRQIDAGESPSYRSHYTYKRKFVEGIGTGLVGAYFDNIHSLGEPVFTRIDPEVDFVWDYESTVLTSQRDSTSIRWSGSLLAPVTGDYTFFIDFDDRVSLYLDGTPIIVDTFSRNGASKEAKVSLEAGSKYNIELVYVEFEFIARIRLSWSFPDQEKEVIPKMFLYPEKTEPVSNLPVLTGNPGFQIYPNPTQNLLHLKGLSPSVARFRVVISDPMGRRFLEHELYGPTSQWDIDISSFDQGVYLLTLTHDDQVSTFPFFKE